MKNNNKSHFESCEYKKIVKILKGFSLEITPFVADKIENLSQFIKPSTTIFITFLPGSDYKDTINISKNISEYTDIANNTVGSFSEGFLKSLMEKKQHEDETQ